MLSCGFDPWSGHNQKPTSERMDEWTKSMLLSLSLTLSPFFSKNKIKQTKKRQRSGTERPWCAAQSSSVRKGGYQHMAPIASTPSQDCVLVGLPPSYGLKMFGPLPAVTAQSCCNSPGLGVFPPVPVAPALGFIAKNACIFPELSVSV